MNLDLLNPNPFLIRALNLYDPNKMIEFYVFARSIRSIVTSFGFAFEDLLIASGGRRLPRGFDIFKVKDGITYKIQ